MLLGWTGFPDSTGCLYVTRQQGVSPLHCMLLAGTQGS